MKNVLWRMPVCSSGLTGVSGFRQIARRECLLVIATKENDGGDLQIIFEGVEAYRATYYNARSLEMVRASYDELVDLGDTDWLHEINKRMTPGIDRSGKLYNLLINFDDGPCYEFICRSYRVEDTDWQNVEGLPESYA
jgi:hypothetical protein